MTSGDRANSGAQQGTNTSQTFDDVCAILKSLPTRKLKGVRLEINAEWFGTSWASSDACSKPRFVGVVKQWKTKNAVLMVKWDGWDQCRQSVLDSMDTDDNGDDLRLRLLPYENGDAAPELQEADPAEVEQPPAGCGTAGGRGRHG